MQKIIFHFFAMVLLWQPIRVASQPIASISAYNILQEERDVFLQHFKSIASDTATAYPLARYVESEVENIRKTVIADAAFLPELEKEKATRSLAFFMKEVDKHVAQ